jgi:putative Mg2+ transporter-C (MgtC) family protein
MNWIAEFWRSLQADFALPSGFEAGQVIGRVMVAALLGGVLGLERMHKGKAAGVRTHILVSLAAAFFVLAPMQAGMELADLSRIIQGVAAGVGFLGAGTILKQSEQGHIIGLTTAASLYLATAIGIAAGLGRESTAVVATVVALIVLSLLPEGGSQVDNRPAPRSSSSEDERDQ